MALSYTLNHHVNAPPKAVFEAMLDIEDFGAWMENFVRVERLDEGEMGPGSSWREVRKIMGREGAEVFEIRALEPDRRLELYVDGTKGSTGRGEYHYVYELEEREGGTAVKLHGEMEMGALFNLFGRLMLPMFKKMVNKDLEALARHVEGRGQA
ncbi:SRPBCC family protein [Lujinxingia vulgaris]|uniref:SRPBCC family protein n=1 Tax=Lujinxingia vulgaris TaxID=2600176 RepID=UPI001E3D6695|nr:SRPBCC family protein [Lujinxingia vulgaris]